MGKVTAAVRIADEVWIATALLHREHPRSPDFAIEEIVARVEREGMTDSKRAGVYTHVAVHCVANRPPKPARYRMLFMTTAKRRRLFRPGDPYDPRRDGAKTTPAREEIPAKYHRLLDWYETEWVTAAAGDPLLALATRHRDLWKGVDADEYVSSLREGFE